jgi:Sugar transferases involved in lipopolysaccharide synthesis
MYRNLLKPLFDFIVALCLLIVLSPVIVLATILLTIVNNGKPLFFQLRPGKDEHIFRIIKFKTMNDAKDNHGNLLPDEKRLTIIGRIIRKTSIDELPQLMNVLKGDMSLVGPRPLLVQYLPLYNDLQRRRHSVKPGITGWAQVNGRNAIDWNTKFMYDVYYVDHLSFLLDVNIIFKTILNVFKSQNISQQGQATVDYFKGSN